MNFNGSSGHEKEHQKKPKKIEIFIFNADFL